ncbi:MAG TPA: hypothetical protein VKN74_02820 [Candidatus Mcinerneyibacterium sp.]|nr:hypothetical protein [Candidatus Mcinerneyibacterium sp.]
MNYLEISSFKLDKNISDTKRSALLRTSKKANKKEVKKLIHKNYPDLLDIITDQYFITDNYIIISTNIDYLFFHFLLN